MILDKLENLETYKNLSPDIYEGLKYLANVDPEIPIGSYRINDRLVANVMEYMTVEEFKLGYEAHKKNLDIQYVVRGHERIKWSPIKGMDVKTPYNEQNDATFYENPTPYGGEIIIGNGNFSIMFPQDGHACQYYVGQCELIKKIVVKVNIEER